jgi:hypothetical protein
MRTGLGHEEARVQSDYHVVAMPGIMQPNRKWECYQTVAPKLLKTSFAQSCCNAHLTLLEVSYQPCLAIGTDHAVPALMLSLLCDS